MEDVNFLISFVEAHRYTGYAILFFSMIIEGELILLAAGILSNLGAFDFMEVWTVVFLGVLFSDVVWYSLGRFFQNKYPDNRLIRFVERRVRRMFPTIEKNPFKLVFASKFLYGFNHSTIFILGFLKTDFRHFFKVQFQTSFLWVSIFLVLGYFFGYTALHITNRINKFVLAMLIILIAFFILERSIDHFVAKRVLEKRKDLESN